MSISFGLRQGTHPSLLPDLAAPSRWARATRVAQSPIPGLSDDEDISAAPAVISAGSEFTIGMATGSTDGPTPRGSSSSKKSRKPKKRRMSDKAVSEAEAVAAAGPSAAASSSRSLKLKVPPLNAIMQGDAAADPNEPKYCYCNRVSFGNVRRRLSRVFELPVLRVGFAPLQMVACDYPECKREWVRDSLNGTISYHTHHPSPSTVSPRLCWSDGAAAISNVVLRGLRATRAEWRPSRPKKERTMMDRVNTSVHFVL